MEKFGFVYIWRNRRLNRYYIGSHWGTEDDGYICSNDAMREAHRRNPKAFRRRIVKKVHSREDLLIEEQRWLDMIKPEEYGKKFYNISSSANGSWAGAWNPKFREKWMGSHWSRNGKTQDVVAKINTPKRNKKIQKSVQTLYDNGYINPNKGKFWINDRVTEQYIKGGIPAGWKKGRIHNEGAFTSESTKSLWEDPTYRQQMVDKHIGQIAWNKGLKGDPRCKGGRKSSCV